MKLIVEDRSEAMETARMLINISEAIRYFNIDDILQTSFKIYLSRMRNSIEVWGETE